MSPTPTAPVRPPAAAQASRLGIAVATWKRGRVKGGREGKTALRSFFFSFSVSRFETRIYQKGVALPRFVYC